MCYFLLVHTVLQFSDPSRKKKCVDFEGIPILCLKPRNSENKKIGMMSSDYTRCGLCVNNGNTALGSSLIKICRLKAQHVNRNLSKYIYIFNYILCKLKW